MIVEKEKLSWKLYIILDSYKEFIVNIKLYV